MTLKLGVLLAFCGGPLVLFDLLKPHTGTQLAFGLMFLPAVLVVFGAYSLWQECPTRWDRAMVWCGLAGTALLMIMDLAGLLELASSGHRADAGLIQLGIAVGVVVIGVYGYFSYKFLRAASTDRACSQA